MRSCWSCAQQYSYGPKTSCVRPRTCFQLRFLGYPTREKHSPTNLRVNSLGACKHRWSKHSLAAAAWIFRPACELVVATFVKIHHPADDEDRATSVVMANGGGKTSALKCSPLGLETNTSEGSAFKLALGTSRGRNETKEALTTRKSSCDVSVVSHLRINCGASGP